MTKMELRMMEKERLAALYQEAIAGDFPATERKPLSAMLKLYDMGRYDALLAVEDEEAAGFISLSVTAYK